MSVEPVQTNPSEFECKGSRGWISRLPLYRKVAQHAQAAALGLAPYRPRVKLWFLQDRALNFAGVARVQVRASSERQDIHAALLRRCCAALASSGAGIGTLQTKGQAFVFAIPTGF
eukprot:s2941_g9.t1